MTAPRKTLQQMQAEANGQEPMQIAGKPATVCPYCGIGMYVDKTLAGDKEIVRYIQCRNKKCGRRFVSYQQPAKLLREIGTDDDSAHGKPHLTLIRESA